MAREWPATSKSAVQSTVRRRKLSSSLLLLQWTTTTSQFVQLTSHFPIGAEAEAHLDSSSSSSR